MMEDTRTRRSGGREARRAARAASHGSAEAFLTRTMKPFEIVSDEGLVHTMAIMGRVVARPANVRKMLWLMPRMAKAVPYLGYIVVAARKPR